MYGDFHGLTPDLVLSQPAPLTSPIWKTGLRMLEQGIQAGLVEVRSWNCRQVPIKLQLGDKTLLAPNYGYKYGK